MLNAAETGKAGATGPTGPTQTPVYITIQGLRDEDMAKSCLRTLNRYRRRPFAFPEKGDGEYQIIIEKKRPGFQVRVEKMGSALKTARALYDYEICIAAAAITREAIADE